jgi:hypothetical protein
MVIIGAHWASPVNLVGHMQMQHAMVAQSLKIVKNRYKVVL